MEARQIAITVLENMLLAEKIDESDRVAELAGMLRVRWMLAGAGVL